MQGQQETEDGNVGFSDSLREIQGEYIMLGELYEKQKSYAQGLSEVIRAMQNEVDTVIQIKPEALATPCRAAYLVSEGVVVVFDLNGGMASRPLYSLPAEVIVSIIQECTPELHRLLAEKRRKESNKAKSMESVLKELQKAQFMFKATKRDETGLIPSPIQETEEADPSPQAEKIAPQAEVIAPQVEVIAPQVESHPAPAEKVGKEPAPEAPKSKNPFAFIGTFGKSGAQQPSPPNKQKNQPPRQ
ncbi:MAG TPA: hypothetical protein VLU91_01150 [Nitrososphaerales archaeon]|nr:hypothetical protein [Nitrososphaerales archaeon]